MRTNEMENHVVESSRDRWYLQKARCHWGYYLHNRGLIKRDLVNVGRKLSLHHCWDSRRSCNDRNRGFSRLERMIRILNSFTRSWSSEDIGTRFGLWGTATGNGWIGRRARKTQGSNDTSEQGICLRVANDWNWGTMRQLSHIRLFYGKIHRSVKIRPTK